MLKVSRGATLIILFTMLSGGCANTGVPTIARHIREGERAKVQDVVVTFKQLDYVYWDVPGNPRGEAAIEILVTNLSSKPLSVAHEDFILVIESKRVEPKFLSILPVSDRSSLQENVNRIFGGAGEVRPNEKVAVTVAFDVSESDVPERVEYTPSGSSTVFAMIPSDSSRDEFAS